jgi:hypothetical protein
LIVSATPETPKLVQAEMPRLSHWRVLRRRRQR